MAKGEQMRFLRAQREACASDTAWTYAKGSNGSVSLSFNQPQSFQRYRAKLVLTPSIVNKVLARVLDAQHHHLTWMRSSDGGTEPP
jgi:hypothetical protein